MRSISKISIHCMASNRPSHDNPDVLYQWHVLENGWSMIGYHVFIDSKGKVWDETNHPLMRPYSRIPAAVKYHNSGMIAICLWGNDKDDFTSEQIYSLRKVVRKLRDKYDLEQWAVKGHNEYKYHEKRGCPGMDVQEVLFGTRGTSNQHINKLDNDKFKRFRNYNYNRGASHIV